MIKTIYTVGFTKKNAENFFSTIRDAEVVTMIDVRLNNVSQLAGFAKRDDLKFFLGELCDCEYQHIPAFAPTKDILDSYKNKTITWVEYENRFLSLLEEREAGKLLTSFSGENICLLCSEAQSENCHRRLVAEYLVKYNSQIEIVHLGQ